MLRCNLDCVSWQMLYAIMEMKTACIGKKSSWYKELDLHREELVNARMIVDDWLDEVKKKIRETQRKIQNEMD